METCHMHNNGQPQSTVALSSTRGVEAVKRLKSLLKQTLRHAITLIPNLNRALICSAQQPQHHRGLAIGESVINQVGNSSTQGNWLDHDLQCVQLKLQLIGGMTARHLCQQLIQRNGHREFFITATCKQQELTCDSFQRLQVTGTTFAFFCAELR